MDFETALQPLQPWFAATGVIENWATGARALALLRASLASGLPDRLVPLDELRATAVHPDGPG